MTMKKQFRFSVERGERVVLLRLEGGIAQEATSRLQTVMQKLINKGWHYLLVDFEKVYFIDSTAIGMLLMFNAECRRVGGRLGLCGAASPVADILQVTTRNLVFGFYPDARTGAAEMERIAVEAGAPPIPEDEDLGGDSDAAPAPAPPREPDAADTQPKRT